MNPAVPTAALASELAADAVGDRPIEVRRFTTGNQHYVFEATFVDRPPVVLRIATENNRPAMTSAFRLSAQLRPLGVPLPIVLAEGLDHQFPYLVLERLPGSDLGEILPQLSDASLEQIAAKVIEAQRNTAQTASRGRYGYAVEAADAPYETWSEALDAALARSRRRILSAGLFDLGPANAVAAQISTARRALDACPPIAHLHDTTTKNVIVTASGKFSGIVDVDDLCFGDPRQVPALTMASLLASDRPVNYVQSWMRLASYRDDGIFRLYVTLFLIDLMSEHGLTSNGNETPSAPQDRQRLQGIFAESLHQTRSSPLST